MSGEPKVVWPLAAELGEGPVWVERDSALWFVDINKRQIHRYDPRTGARGSWDSPEKVGFLFPAEEGGFVAGLASGLHHFDEQTGAFELIAKVEPDGANNRLNDGVVDRAGRLWFGTMDKAEKAKTGAFYCFYRGKLTRTDIGGIAITNGPAVSPDGTILYVVDTLKGTIDAADIHADGALGERRAFVKVDPKEGHPDGPSIDSEGCLWIALYGGWEARRYSPEGELIDRVRFPVSNITKVALGGDALRSAFATTARQKLSAATIAKQPQIGDVFQFAADVPGIPCPLVRTS